LCKFVISVSEKREKCNLQQQLGESGILINRRFACECGNPTKIQPRKSIHIKESKLKSYSTWQRFLYALKIYKKFYSLGKRVK